MHQSVITISDVSEGPYSFKMSMQREILAGPEPRHQAAGW